MRADDVITSVTSLADYSEREGRLGLMLFTVSESQWFNQRGELIKTSRDVADPLLEAQWTSPSARRSRSSPARRGSAAWNRYAAVNDEFIPIHMDDAAGQAAGYSGAFGMGNLQWAWLHCLLRDWLDGSAVGASCRSASSSAGPSLKGLTVQRATAW